ncbi:hypothetical protein NJH54_02520 [Pseudomonas asiatica]|uniref:hypothetical protein n=1 Tax=Pseudomonas TaxID=286 RepID=UPI00146341FE|nr:MULTISPECIES: hypothetical protein [Pseudomonas]MBA1214806.1 hypothetical protein [Pseudomonas fulva]MCO7523384.1 hypothetical protein [Pseudomonas asiatica]QJQ22952.1 hypothetical protein HG549_24460 [Pseudomonas sp. SK]
MSDGGKVGESSLFLITNNILRPAKKISRGVFENIFGSRLSMAHGHQPPAGSTEEQNLIDPASIPAPRGVFYPPKGFIGQEGVRFFFEHHAEPPRSLDA